jgi:hypothetical protein
VSARCSKALFAEVPRPQGIFRGEIGLVVAASGPYFHCDCGLDHDIIDDSPTFAIHVLSVDIEFPPKNGIRERRHGLPWPESRAP